MSGEAWRVNSGGQPVFHTEGAALARFHGTLGRWLTHGAAG